MKQGCRQWCGRPATCLRNESGGKSKQRDGATQRNCALLQQAARWPRNPRGTGNFPPQRLN
eukprot:5253709-Alexandrium_andersonii.AAC.1